MQENKGSKEVRNASCELDIMRHADPLFPLQNTPVYCFPPGLFLKINYVIGHKVNPYK
jgi:hypothetical protein